MGLVKDASDTTRKPKTADHNPNPNLRPKPPGGDDQQPIEGESESESDLGPLENLTPDNYTICAPQLLHLDTDGKPLWFNGWLLDNKFADKSKKRFAEFKSYLVEPRDIRDPGAWQLAESNLCCLTTDADKKFDFEEEDLATLKMIMDRAIEIGAYGNQ